MQEIVVEGKLHQFAELYCGDSSGLEVLLFLGRHPHAWFSQLAIIHALDARKTDIDKATQYLTDKGLVVTQTAENGFSIYSLAEDGSLRDLVLEMASLDQSQYRLILEQIDNNVTEGCASL